MEKMNYVEKLIPALVDVELREANQNHSPFHSMHEGYAVLREEIEEAYEVQEDVKRFLVHAWDYIRKDNLEGARYQARHLEEKAIHLAAEAIQVAAMAKKFQALEADEED